MIQGLREQEASREIAVVAAVVIGLTLSLFHWLGFIVGGGIIGLFASTPRRAFLDAFYFGVLVSVAFALVLLVHGALPAAVEMGQVFAVAVAIPIAASLAGAVAYWLV